MSMKKAKHPIKFGLRVYGAYLFAKWAHRGQKRKYTYEPYIVHPVEVMNIVATVPHTKEMLMAALLHDVVEDCNISNLTVKRLFGVRVARYVYFLTNPPKEADQNRKFRKARDLERLRSAPGPVQTIKCCDLWSNSKSIVQHDPNFAVVYLPEKREILNAMTEADPVILAQVFQVLEDAERILQLSK